MVSSHMHSDLDDSEFDSVIKYGSFLQQTFSCISDKPIAIDWEKLSEESRKHLQQKNVDSLKASAVSGNPDDTLELATRSVPPSRVPCIPLTNLCQMSLYRLYTGAGVPVDKTEAVAWGLWLTDLTLSGSSFNVPRPTRARALALLAHVHFDERLDKNNPKMHEYRRHVPCCEVRRRGGLVGLNVSDRGSHWIHS